MKVIKDIYCKDSRYNNLNIYLPEQKEFDLFIFFHGGGLSGGDISEIEMSAEYLTKNNIAIISADYRRYPDAHYPDFIEDAALAVKWSIEHISNYGRCNKTFIGGSSAGAYLAMMLCFDRKYLGKYGIIPMDFDGFVFDAGQPTTHFNVLCEREIDPKRVIIDEASALYHIGTDDKYPSMLFFVSDNDMEGRYEQTMLTIATLKNFGHVFPNVQLKIMKNSTHCFYLKNEDRNSEYTNTLCSFMNGIKRVECR